MKNLSLTIIIYTLLTAIAFGQDNTNAESQSLQTEKQEIIRRHSIGSSLFILYNFSSDSADFYQFSYGYQPTQKDVFIVEAITWKYSEPLGTYGSSKEDFPGKVRAFGIGAAYQRFHCKNLFTTVEATPFVQQYYDEDNKKPRRDFNYTFKLSWVTGLNSLINACS